ncbi:MAG: hypothetical protein AAGH15_21435, partial [Myxococcota bacterium]
ERLENHLLEAGVPSYRRDRRGPPELRRRRDGSFVWRGPAIGARIAPDGSVRFSDGPGLSWDGTDGGEGLGFRFDITNWAERRAGNDPHRAERRWFLEQTEALRERLGRQALARNQRAALIRLRGDLARLWESPGRPAAARREALFERWRECSSDALGRQARATIVGFIRERLSAESPDAYPEAQLRTLRRRPGGEGFRPYAGSRGP